MPRKMDVIGPVITLVPVSQAAAVQRVHRRKRLQKRAVGMLRKLLIWALVLPEIVAWVGQCWIITRLNRVVFAKPSLVDLPVVVDTIGNQLST